MLNVFLVVGSRCIEAEQAIGPVKYLLPAQAIHHHHNYILRFLGVYKRAEGKQAAKQRGYCTFHDKIN